MKRPNGQGSIYYDKGKQRYAASFVSPSGKRVVKRFRTEEEAEAWLEDNRYQIRHNTFVTPSSLKTGTWLVTYLDTYKQDIRPQTMEKYLFFLERLAPLAEIQLQRLTSLDIQTVVNGWQKEGLSTGYIQNLLMLLNAAIKKAIALDLLVKNPMMNVERPRVTHKRIEIFTVDEVRRMLAYSECRRYRRAHAEILVAAYTGMRIGEVLALNWADISKEYIRVTKTIARPTGSWAVQEMPKTSSSHRTISIPLSVYEGLLDYRNATKETTGLVFRGKTGNVVQVGYESQKFKQIQAAVGIKPLRGFHALRHTHASQLLANGVPIAEVSKRLGHSNPAITLHTYTSWIPGQDMEVAADVADIFD